MAQQLRALAALPEDLTLIPITHITAHSCNSSVRGSDTLLWPLLANTCHVSVLSSTQVHTDTHAQNKILF